MHEAKLGVWDFVAIAGYFAAVIGAGVFVSILSITFVMLCINSLKTIDL